MKTSEKLYLFNRGEYIRDSNKDEFEFIRCLSRVQAQTEKGLFDRLMYLDDVLSKKMTVAVLIGLGIYFILGLLVGGLFCAL